MHGIGGHDLTGDLHGSEKSAEFGNLVGFLVHVLLGHDDPPVLEEGCEGVDLLAPLGLRGSPDRLAVDGQNRDLSAETALRKDLFEPAREDTIDLLDVDRLKCAPEGGFGGSDQDLCFRMPPEPQSLLEGVRKIGGPFGHGACMADAGENGAHESGDKGDLGMSDSPPLPGVRSPGEIVHEMLNVSFSKGLDGHAGLLCLENGKVVGGREKAKRILSQGTDEDAFDRAVIVVAAGVSPVPLCFPQILEACGLIAGSGKAGGVDEGLDEDDGMAVSVFPVGRKPMQAEGQHLRGQVGKRKPSEE